MGKDIPASDVYNNFTSYTQKKLELYSKLDQLCKQTICNLAVIVDPPSGWSKHLKKERDSLESSCQKKKSCSLRDVSFRFLL